MITTTSRSLLLLFSIGLGMAGCTLPPQRVASVAQATLRPFLAATLVPPPTLPAPTQTPVGSTQVPTSTPTAFPNAPGCTNALVFISDLTIPDGTVVSPGASIDKQWEIENGGSCNWEEGYQLKWISGLTLGAPEEQSLFPARAGSHATLSLQLEAPSVPGNYVSAWQAYDPEGYPFGDPIFIDFVVE